MMSQTGKQAIAINILPGISKRKDNEKMKFDQLIHVKYIFLQNFKSHAENEAGRLVPHLFAFREALYEVKASDHRLCFDVFW